MNTARNLLIISSHAPYGMQHSKDALDIALACSVFNIKVSMLFLDDGIYQLIKNQQSKLIGKKNLESMLSALPVYDIDKIYVSHTDLTTRGLDEKSLFMHVNLLESNEINRLIQQQDQVLHF